MGRKRRRINEGLPPYVYRRRHGFIYRPYIGAENGKPKFGKDVFLGPLDTPLREIWVAYDQALGKTTDTLNWLLDQYHRSAQFRDLAPKTRKDYEGYRKTLSAQDAGGKPFGQFSLVDIDMYTIRGYLDTYSRNGRRAPISANRQIQYLKAVWNWSLQRHKDIPPNPCIGVSLNKQTPRKRLVTREDYEKVRELATGYVPIMMEIAYLCRARRSEITALKRSDVLEDGLRLVRSKGSEGEITLWSPRLRAAVEAAKAFNADAPSPVTGAYLIHDKAGQPIKKNAFDSAWQKVMKAAEAAGIERFTFHDLKSYGVTEHPTNHSGHKSPKMRDVYVRRLPKVQATE
jgi:integrase